MSKSDVVGLAFDEADEKKLDRAVRRLPGFWCWGDCTVDSGVAACISPPWQEDWAAFVVEKDQHGYHLMDGMEGRATGHYRSLDILLRGVRAVVMGDPFDPDQLEDAPAPRGDVRQTAKGSLPPRFLRGKMGAEQLQRMEDIAAAWEDSGVLSVEVTGQRVYVPWDSRFPAFELTALTDTRIGVRDNLTVDGHQWRGVYRTVAGAMAAVRATITGVWDQDDPEFQARVAAYRAESVSDRAELAELQAG